LEANNSRKRVQNSAYLVGTVISEPNLERFHYFKGQLFFLLIFFSLYVEIALTSDVLISLFQYFFFTLMKAELQSL